MTTILTNDFTIETDDIFAAVSEPVFRIEGDAEPTLLNLGVIRGSGMEAIGVLATTAATIDNRGRIEATSSGSVWGALFQDGGAFVNQGVIELGVDAAQAVGVGFTRGTGRVNNSGDIFATGSSRGVGIELADGGTVSNAGRIYAAGDRAIGIAIRGFDAPFVNDGVISARGRVAIGLDLTGAGHFETFGPTIVNRGTISAAVAYLDRSSTDNSIRDYFINEGTITGDILLEDGDDQFVNTGTMRGNIQAGRGADVIDLRGGRHEGVVYLQDGDDVLFLDAGLNSVTAEAGNDFVLGGADSDVVSGDDGDDSLDGAGGEDYLEGGAGDDYLDGGAGADTLVGMTGGDSYFVDNAGDRFVELRNEGHDRIMATVSIDLTGQYVEDVQLIGLDDIDVRGNSLANTLSGNSADNVLDGRGGSDVLLGGDGDDTYVLDRRSDVVVELSDAGRDTILSSSSVNLSGIYVEQVFLTGSADTYVKGNSLRNVLVGNDGDNRLNGGGHGDALTGGLGADVFVWDRVADSTLSRSDRITDLTAVDTLDLSRLDADTTRDGDQGFVRVAAFTGSAGELTMTYDATTGLTSLLADIDGDGQADFWVRLNGDHTAFENFIF